MAKNYHVICIPTYFWRGYEIRTPSQLLSLSNVLSRMFSFEKTNGLEKRDSEDLSILTSSFVWNTEIYNVREITKLVNENLIENLQIEHIFITDYCFEITSSNPKILSQSGFYSELAREISKITFKNCLKEVKNVDIFEHPAIITYLEIITCDTLNEIEEQTKEDNLKKITEHFYINNCTPFFSENAPWNKISIPNLIVTLKPKIMVRNRGEFYLTADKLGLYISLVHAIGKIFTISKSIKGTSANLVITNLDEICQNFESTFNILKRNFFNTDRDFYNLFKEFKESVQPLTLLSNPIDKRIVEKEYRDIYPQIEESLSILQYSRVKELLNNSDKIIDIFMEDKRIYGKIMIEFLNRFQHTINTWREINQSKINHNKMMSTLVIGIISIIISLLK